MGQCLVDTKIQLTHLGVAQNIQNCGQQILNDGQKLIFAQFIADKVRDYPHAAMNRVRGAGCQQVDELR